ncbi:Protein F14H12.3 [Aphelenchoides avenae]|nr:Protein F14H12.3 [Aphelenchus avenae]
MRWDIQLVVKLCLFQAFFVAVAPNVVAYNPGPCTTCGQSPPQPQPCTTCGSGGIVIIPQPCVTCVSPQAGSWGPWSDWSLCEQQFGGGSSNEARPCLTYQDEPPTTPRSVLVGEWGPWSQCSASCGRGTRSRQRQCTFSGGAPAACNVPTSEQEVCDMGTCCQRTSWMAWSECSVTCGGGGVRYRTRQCTCDRDSLYFAPPQGSRQSKLTQ